MTFEEFEKLVNVNVVEHLEDFQLRVSASFNTMRYVPKDRLNGRVQLDDIERAMKLQLWEYMQKQVGHTDRELDHAYGIGFVDGMNGQHRDYDPEPYREPVEG